MKMVLTGAGTGGHLYPALAIGHTMQTLTNCSILFVGTRYGLENRVVPMTGYPLKKVWIRGLKRGFILKNILFPVRMIVSLIQCLAIIAGSRPDIIVGTGGYVSWPVLTAGILLRKKTFIQEQNQKPGLVTKVLALCKMRTHQTAPPPVPLGLACSQRLILLLLCLAPPLPFA